MSSCVSELRMLQTGSFRSAELCVGISCLLAKSEPQNHFPLRLFVTLPQTERQTQRQADGRPILFRAISFPPFSRLTNNCSLPLHGKLLNPILGLKKTNNVQYMLNRFYHHSIYKTMQKFIAVKIMYGYRCEKQTPICIEP